MNKKIFMAIEKSKCCRKCKVFAVNGQKTMQQKILLLCANIKPFLISLLVYMID